MSLSLIRVFPFFSRSKGAFLRNLARARSPPPQKRNLLRPSLSHAQQFSRKRENPEDSRSALCEDDGVEREGEKDRNREDKGIEAWSHFPVPCTFSSLDSYLVQLSNGLALLRVVTCQSRKLYITITIFFSLFFFSLKGNSGTSGYLIKFQKIESENKFGNLNSEKFGFVELFCHVCGFLAILEKLFLNYKIKF